MPKQPRSAGQNIRELELKRRVKAVKYFIGAGLILLLPFLLINKLDNFLKEIISNNSSQPQSSLNIPPIFYLMFIVIALLLVTNGTFLWKRANNAAQGARGEEDVSRELFQLEHEGWNIEYGMRLANKLGDADMVCISPQGKAYVIDVKSHKGQVMVNDEQLSRRMGKVNYHFEKDFIQQMIKQALQVKKQKGLKFVTPILVFSKAKVYVPGNRLRKVYVIEKSRLVSLLKSLG